MSPHKSQLQGCLMSSCPVPGRQAFRSMPNEVCMILQSATSCARKLLAPALSISCDIIPVSRMQVQDLLGHVAQSGSCSCSLPAEHSMFCLL